MKKIKVKTKIKVPFYDLDPMNIVWHGNYVKYIEVARCGFFEALNYTYEDMKNDGVCYPIAKMDLKFIKSAYFGQDLIVETELVEIEPAVLFKYTIYDEKTNEKIFKANSMQIGVSIETKESVLSAPDNFKKRIEAYVE